MKDILSLVLSAFLNAISKELPDQDKKRLHHARSRTWIDSLNKEFVHYYKDDRDVRVFSKNHKGNGADFKLNELLHDISVCRIGFAASAGRKKELMFIKEALWQATED